MALLGLPYDYFNGVAIDKRLSIACLAIADIRQCLVTNVCQWLIFGEMSIDKRLALAISTKLSY